MLPAPSKSLTIVLALLISSVSGQVTQCASGGSPQLRFVAQLSVSGCALFVHDTGANDGSHFAVEPVMCVTDSPNKFIERYDAITQQTYVSMPVILRDDAMLAEVQNQLRHLSPMSVKFAVVSDITVSTDAASVIQALGFDWIQQEPVGFLRLVGRNYSDNKWIEYLRRQDTMLDVFNNVVFAATIIATNGGMEHRRYKPTVQNQSHFDASMSKSDFLPTCQQLRFIRTIRLKNCTARVHERLNMKGHFLIEPLLCHNITNMSNESIMYDYSRDMYYLKLDVVLQDDITLDAVRTQLADLSPRSVAFMRLWRAQSVVASALSRRFVIGPLMVSADWRSAQVRVYCKTDDDCERLRSSIITEPFNLWRHVWWSITSVLSDRCLLKSDNRKYPWVVQEGAIAQVQRITLDAACPIRDPCKFRFKTPDGRSFAVIQQRLTGRMSFQRNWTEYESGFGDETDFWIGLSTIHSLSINGATLRVEMKLWNGTELHAEFSGFKVGNASTKYLMTYREMLMDRSSVSDDTIQFHKGIMFSTMDIDNDDRSTVSCSHCCGGKGGWWFRYCSNFHPNGVYGGGTSQGDMSWYYGSWLALREVRLMLQI